MLAVLGDFAWRLQADSALHMGLLPEFMTNRARLEHTPRSHRKNCTERRCLQPRRPGPRSQNVTLQRFGLRACCEGRNAAYSMP